MRVRGIAEISNILATSYNKEGKKELEARLVYNALSRYKKEAEKSTNFTVLYPLGALLSKMAPIHQERNQNQQAMDSLKNALVAFKDAEKAIQNYKESLIYDFYVDYAKAWMFMYKLCQETGLEYRSDQPLLKEAQDRIDKGLGYNTVYGLEAIRLRQQILDLDPALAKSYEDTFAA